MKLLLAFIIFVTAAKGEGQIVPPLWVTVANEGDTVVLGSSPVTVRFGAPAGTPVTNAGSVPCTTTGGCWDVPLTLTSGPPVTITVNLAEFGGIDPAYGTVKTLQVAETSVTQTLTVNGVQKTVPALPAPVVTPPITPVGSPVAFTLQFTCQMTTASPVPISCMTTVLP